MGFSLEYSLQWFLLKPPHWGFGIFFHWYLYRNTCVEFENVMKSATKKKGFIHGYVCYFVKVLIDVYKPALS